MSSVTLGRTGLVLEKNGFGALPIQRISDSEAVYLLRKAYDAGFRFFDTARYYTDSEKKLGIAFAGMSDAPPEICVYFRIENAPDADGAGIGVMDV
jgi:aryl-alcohol dehydrogenase-like predicted oxidoreductase